jgi:hypothetical protein
MLAGRWGKLLGILVGLGFEAKLSGVGIVE